MLNREYANKNHYIPGSPGKTYLKKYCVKYYLNRGGNHVVNVSSRSIQDQFLPLFLSRAILVHLNNLSWSLSDGAFARTHAHVSLRGQVGCWPECKSLLFFVSGNGKFLIFSANLLSLPLSIFLSRARSLSPSPFETHPLSLSFSDTRRLLQHSLKHTFPRNSCHKHANLFQAQQ